MVNALKACQAEKEREEANARKQQNSHGNPHPKNSTNSGSKK